MRSGLAALSILSSLLAGCGKDGERGAQAAAPPPVTATPPPPVAATTAIDAREAAGSGDEGGVEKPAKPPPPTTTAGPGGAPRSADLAADRAELDAEAQRYAALLTGPADDSAPRRGPPPGADLAREIEEVRAAGAQVGIGGSTMGGTAGGPHAVGTGAAPQVAVTVAVTSQRAIDETSLTADVVTRKIKGAYMSGVNRCYRAGLRADPGLAGTLKLSFTVNERGRSVGGKAAGLAAEVESCVEGLITSWTFAVPEDDDGEPTEASFEIVLALAPA